MASSAAETAALPDGVYTAEFDTDSSMFHANEACDGGRVTVNGKVARASYDVKAGDVSAVRKMQVTYSYRVLDLVSSRQPAKNVPLYCLNITPQEELDKLSIPRETIFVFRDRGTGRPTKKERRELDGLMDGIYYDGDE